MTPIFGEEAYRLPVGAGRGTVGTVRALRVLSVRSSYIPLYIPYNTQVHSRYTMCRPSVFPSAEAW
jgi:hypothetical protein